VVQFRDSLGVGPASAVVDIPVDATPKQLNELLRGVTAPGNVDDVDEYAFFLEDETAVLSSLRVALEDAARRRPVDTETATSESVLVLRYRPQARFHVRPVHHCSATLPGHAEAVLSVSFSPDSRRLASGSGDHTVRIWDTVSTTPAATLKTHAGWVLCVAWAPSGRRLASGGMDGQVWIHAVSDMASDSAKTSHKLGSHSKWITGLAWEPMHRCTEATVDQRLASGSKDTHVRIWNVAAGRCERILSGHTKSVTVVRWGGNGWIYSASQDRTIKVWEADTGRMLRTLDGHGHWVNTMALSTDYVMRTGPFDFESTKFHDIGSMVQSAREKYSKSTTGDNAERLVSGSDDFTLQLWEPAKQKSSVTRMTGHQQLVNMVCFSPDQNWIASASFDKSVRLWSGITGKFVTTFRAHVGAVYMVAWSGDSRLLLSASRDSTVKVFDIRTKKLRSDLPGHADEVFAVDWSPDGSRVASGGKDKVIKFWHN